MSQSLSLFCWDDALNYGSTSSGPPRVPSCLVFTRKGTSSPAALVIARGGECFLLQVPSSLHTLKSGSSYGDFRRNFPEAEAASILPLWEAPLVGPRPAGSHSPPSFQPVICVMGKLRTNGSQDPQTFISLLSSISPADLGRPFLGSWSVSVKLASCQPG